MRCVLPMSLISGLFSYENLLPSALMSGLRIEIQLAPGVQAIRAREGATGYGIDKCRIECDCYNLTDSIQRQLNESAASSGLEVVFRSYFSTLSSRTTNTANIESRRAVSRGLTALYREVPADRTMGNPDPMATRAFNVTSFQARVGSLYFPNSQITGPSELPAAADCYFMALKSFGQYNTNIPSHLASSYESYVNDTSVLAVGLERSNVLDLSGIH